MAILKAMISLMSSSPRKKVLACLLLLPFVVLPQPAAALSIETVLEAKEFSIFTNALKKSGLWDRIAMEGAVTLFVVSDQAMKNEGSDFLLEKVMFTKPNEERLQNLMAYHLLIGSSILPEDVGNEIRLNTSVGSCLLVYRDASGMRVGPEAIVTSSVAVENGMIYVIDRLLWQPWENDGPCAVATN
jgi:uncharacterized surface protein with fasciclin (FAS1) repeats